MTKAEGYMCGNVSKVGNNGSCDRLPSFFRMPNSWSTRIKIYHKKIANGIVFSEFIHIFVLES